MSTAAAPILKAPFPYFGGKSRAAHLVWERFGAVRNYVEPFFGSGAVLLMRPTPFEGVETINDADGMLANFWRATRADPDGVAHHADWPVNENDLHARHAWLVSRKDSLHSRLEGDPDYFDAKIAGWWCWGLCAWIGNGWCSGKGPWLAVDGQLVRGGDQAEDVGVKRRLPHLGDAGRGVNRQRPNLGDAGRGVHRQLPHLGNAGRGVNRQQPHLGDAGQGIKRQQPHLGNAGQGIKRQQPHLGNAGQGVHRMAALTTCADHSEHLRTYFRALADRLRRVRVCCGDWSRVCGRTPTLKQTGITAVFLDPPYSVSAKRDDRLYATDSLSVANDVREWAITQGDNPRMRIALCGYEGEHAMPSGWECVLWKAMGGYGSQRRSNDNPNAKRERIWFSPHCLRSLKP